MLVVRSVSVRFILTTMTSVAATASTTAPLQSPGFDAHSGAPGLRLQKLLSVPGSDPGRVNDLLLLRPDPGGQKDPEAKESSNRHVVFFHGDIQVSVRREEIKHLVDASQVKRHLQH